MKSRLCVNSHDIVVEMNLSFLPLDRYVRGMLSQYSSYLIVSDAGAYNRNYLERT
jgi:hypothetical protein